MTTSTRLRGNVNPVFTIKVGSGTATSYSDDLKKVAITSDAKDSKDLTFAEAALGAAKDYTLELTAVTSFDTGALWKYLWTTAGSDAAILYGPRGNATPTATQPHFSFNVTLARPDIEVEASSDNVGADFEVKLLVVGPITLLTA